MPLRAIFGKVTTVVYQLYFYDLFVTIPRIVSSSCAETVTVTIWPSFVCEQVTSLSHHWRQVNHTCAANKYPLLDRTGLEFSPFWTCSSLHVDTTNKKTYTVNIQHINVKSIFMLMILHFTLEVYTSLKITQLVSRYFWYRKQTFSILRKLPSYEYTSPANISKYGNLNNLKSYKIHAKFENSMLVTRCCGVTPRPYHLYILDDNKIINL